MTSIINLHHADVFNNGFGSQRMYPINERSYPYDRYNLANNKIQPSCLSDVRVDFPEKKLPERVNIPMTEDPKEKKILDFLVENAKHGRIMHQKESLVQVFTNVIPDTQNIIKQLAMKNLIQVTTRKFGPSNQFFEISIKLNEVSFEAIYWIILSIKLDKMIPTDKLIHSRIKEYFGLKYRFEEWQKCLRELERKPCRAPNMHASKFLVQQVDILDSDQEKASRYEVYLKNEKWESEDADDKLSPKQISIYKSFVQYIEKFFDAGSSSNDEYNGGDLLSQWLSSVQTDSISKKNNHHNDYVLKRGMLQRNIKIGIPGGKYGCCQYIKHCGPENLRSLPLGLLSKFVQKALNDKIVSYYKTVLIKNTPLVSSPSPDSNKLDIVKRNIIDLVRMYEKDEGVLLSQIPTLYHEYYNEKLDLVKLGQTKLKTLLKEISDLKLKKEKTNLIYVRSAQQSFLINEIQINRLQQIAQSKEQLQNDADKASELLAQINESKNDDIIYKPIHLAHNYSFFFQNQFVEKDIPLSSENLENETTQELQSPTKLDNNTVISAMIEAILSDAQN